jgi:hypothetical protein
LRHSLVPALALTLIASASRSRNAEPPTLVPNSNTLSAGTLDNGVLTLDLEAVRAKWHAGWHGSRQGDRCFRRSW